MSDSLPLVSDDVFRHLIGFLNEMRDNAVANAKHINKLYDHIEIIEHRLKKMEQKVDQMSASST